MSAIRAGELHPFAKRVSVKRCLRTFRPGIIRMDRDYAGAGLVGPAPAQDLKRGDILLTYAYRGEGFSAVWFKGTYYSDFDISFTKWPDGQGCGGARVLRQVSRVNLYRTGCARDCGRHRHDH
jgi:hypothetical protein